MLLAVRSGDVIRSFSTWSSVRVARGRAVGRAREIRELGLLGLQGSAQLDLAIELRFVPELPLQGGDLAFELDRTVVSLPITSDTFFASARRDGRQRLKQRRVQAGQVDGCRKRDSVARIAGCQSVLK